MSPRLLLVALALAAASCASNHESANVTCSWSGAADAHKDEAAHICADDDGKVEAFHFQPGSRVTLALRDRPKTLTVGQDGRVETRVPNEPGIVAVTGTKANGEPFSNGLTLLPHSK